MKIKLFISFYVGIMMSLHAQEMSTKADKLFYSYNYKQAIEAYNKDIASGKLMTNHQFLNLADAYFKTKDYRRASEIYLDVNKKDTIMSPNRFNMLLQSLAKTAKIEKVKAFMETKRDDFSNELIENAEFNFELLGDTSIAPQEVEIFNSNGNSIQTDFSPAFYKDQLLFSSSRPKKSKKIYGPSGESYLDIYVARIAEGGRIVNPKQFTGVPESEYHKSTPQYAEKDDKMYYILSNTEDGELSFDEKGKNALALGMSYDNGFFRFMLRDLSTSFYYPFFDPNGDKLYFSAAFDDQGFGGTDIYFVYTNNGQIMSEPINLGARINSPGNEIAPFIHDGSLYFSSDIFYGLGGMDVYKSNIQTDDSFSIPVNIGQGINTDKDDFGFIMRTDEKKGFVGYFASNRPGGMGKDDVYGFVMKQKPGLKTFALKGKVTDLSTNRGIAKAHIRLIGKEGKVIKDLSASPEGDFRVEIPWQDEITIQSTQAGHSVFMTKYTGPEVGEVQKTPLNIGIRALDDFVKVVEDKYVLDHNNFFFARYRSDLTPAIRTEMNTILEAISVFPELQIRIQTHTDSRGSSSSNERVSQKRADVIKAYLLKNGASPSNILEAVGYGEDRIMNNCTNGVYCLDFLHEQNRRTLFVIENYDALKL